jgi:hypothetical protein
LFQAEHNQEVDTATDYLYKSSIPQFALSILKFVDKTSDVSTLNISTLMHRAGIHSSKQFSLKPHFEVLVTSTDMRIQG